jgi:nitrogen regulatory protein P-II 1
VKKIEAVVRLEKFEEVKEALKNIGYPGMTVTRIEGHGKQKGLVQQFRGREYKLELLPKIKIEVAVKDEDVSLFVETVVEAARTGEVGDGKIFVIPVEEVVRIRTGEAGEVAV